MFIKNTPLRKAFNTVILTGALLYSGCKDKIPEETFPFKTPDASSPYTNNQEQKKYASASDLEIKIPNNRTNPSTSIIDTNLPNPIIDTNPPASTTPTDIPVSIIDTNISLAVPARNNEYQDLMTKYSKATNDYALALNKISELESRLNTDITEENKYVMAIMREIPALQFPLSHGIIEKKSRKSNSREIPYTLDPRSRHIKTTEQLVKYCEEFSNYVPGVRVTSTNFEFLVTQAGVPESFAKQLEENSDSSTKLDSAARFFSDYKKSFNTKISGVVSYDSPAFLEIVGPPAYVESIIRPKSKLGKPALWDGRVEKMEDRIK